jgi:uncharacterized protein YkwD
VALILLLLSATPALAGIVGAINHLRSAECGASPLSRLPLRESRELDRVARLLAEGQSFARAQHVAGYRAARSLWIEIGGSTEVPSLERILRRRFCAQLTQPALRNIGIYRQGDTLWVVLAQPFLTPPAQDAAAVRRSVLVLTNAARAQGRDCGGRYFPPVPPLASSPALIRAARAHARDMAAHGFFAHRGSDGSSPGKRVTHAGYRWRLVGENIASGIGTARQVVAGWLSSPPHCANIMTAEFRQMGVAFAVNPASAGVIYWTEDFAAPLNRRRRPRHGGGSAR